MKVFCYLLLRCWFNYDDFINLLRWFDKSFQLILDGNAETALNFEHSWGDGVAVLQFFNAIHKESVKEDFQPSKTQSGRVLKHEFQLDESMQNEIKESLEKFEKRVSRLSLYAKELEGMGKNTLKKSKVSPDAIMQLAFQVCPWINVTGGRAGSSTHRK